jgi:L-seryl-tRNA(Ser) seleniumtransferase
VDRARRLVDGIGAGEVIRHAAKVGGGALPLLELDGPAVALPGDPDALAAALRAHTPPVMARIHDGRLVLDPRTLADDELDAVIAAARHALGR